MGIKEFVKHQAERPDNIRDIRIDARKEKETFEFDPELEITDLEWRERKSDLKADRRARHWWDFSAGAVILKILFPKRVSELNLNDSVWQNLKIELEKCREEALGIGEVQVAWQDFMVMASRMKILFPERAAELEIGDEEKRGMEKSLKKHCQQRQWLQFLRRAVDMKILFPARTSQSIVSDNEWRELIGELEQERLKDEWLSYSWFAGKMKILFPERASKLKINTFALQKLKFEFESYRNANISGLFQRAFWLKILAAHKVEVTEKGLEITMRDPAENFREEREPMPVRLSFLPK